MRCSWSEAKRQSNLKDHGLGFADAPQVFDGVTNTFEDDRFDYGEQRFVTLGPAGRNCSFHRAHRVAASNSRYLISQGDET